MTNIQCSVKDPKISVCPWHVFIQKWELIILLLIGDSPNSTVNETQISAQAKTWILQRSKGKSKLLCQWVSNPRMRCAGLSQHKGLNTEVTPCQRGEFRGTQIPGCIQYSRVSSILKWIFLSFLFQCKNSFGNLEKSCAFWWKNFYVSSINLYSVKFKVSIYR